MKDDGRSGRPTTSRTDDNIAAVDKMVKGDRNVTSRHPENCGSTDLKRRFEELKTPRPIRQQISTVSDSKTSGNIEQPPHTRHMSAPDYFLFPKVKLQLKGARFDKLKRFRKPWPTS